MKRTAFDVFRGGADGMTSSSDPSHVYVNLGIINADSGLEGLAPPVRASFSESRATPIVSNTSEYDLSVVRFTANGLGPALPLWIPQIQTGQSDPDLTIYKIVVHADPAGAPPVKSTKTLRWITPFNNRTLAPLPQPPITQQDLSSAYYFAQTYQQFVDIFNTALYQGLVDVGLGDLIPNCYLYYNAVTRLFEFNLDPTFGPQITSTPSGYSVALASNYIQLNPPLNNLLLSFNSLYGIPPSLPAGYDLTPTYYTVVPPQTGAGTTGDLIRGLRFVEDYPSTQTGLWSPIDALCFTSSFLPLAPEQGTVPTVVGTSNLGSSGFQTGSGFTPIITDIAFQGAPENALTSTLYSPLAEYRITSLTSAAAVQTVDINVFFRYRLTGELIPVYMPNNSSITMKILFRKKSWGGKV